jgi:hypothetical protein
MREMKEIVLLIHGTNSGSPSDTGTIWWQRGSALTTSLQEALGDTVECQPDRHVFHWSGINSEKERRAAGHELAKWLMRFEAEGQPYHLIGHSHGGSVIWHALRTVIAKGGKLSTLRSWATVGTPFLHFAARRLSWWWIVPAIAVGVATAVAAPEIITYAQVIVDALSDPSTSRYALLGLPLLWMIPLAMLAALSLRLATFANASRQVRQERKYARRAYDTLWQRYAGFWCEVDEAIGGLASTLVIPTAIVPRMHSAAKSPVKRVLAMLAAPVRSSYNMFIARASDEFIWDRVSSRLQGGDRYAYHLIRVTRGPLRSVAAWPALPEEVSTRIVDTANQHATSTLTKVRNVLGLAIETSPGKTGLVTGVSESLNSRELVHNLYFAEDSLVTLLRQHITGQLQHEWLSLGRKMTDPQCGVTSDDDHRPSQRRLAAIKALAVTVIVTLASVSSSLVFESTVRPQVPLVQIERIAGQNLAERVIVSLPQSQSDYDSETVNTIRRWAAALTRSKFADRTMSSANRLPERGLSSSALIVMASVAHGYLQEGLEAQANSVLDQALELSNSRPHVVSASGRMLLQELGHAGRVDDVRQWARGLEWSGDVAKGTAIGLMDSGRLSEAMALLDSGVRPADGVDAYLALVQYSHDQGVKRTVLDKLEKLALTFEDKPSPESYFRALQSETLASVAGEYVEMGDLSRAAELAKTIKGPDYRAVALVRIAGGHIEGGNSLDASRFIELALQTSTNFPELIAEVSQALSILDFANTRASENADEISCRSDAVGSVAQAKALGGDVQGTLDILAKPNCGDRWRARLFPNREIVSSSDRTAVKWLVDSGKTLEAVRTAQRIKDDRNRCFILIALSEEVGPGQRPQLLLQAETAAKSIVADSVRSLMLAKIALQWAKLGQYRYAMQIGEAIQPLDQMDVHATILEHYLARSR